MIDGDNIIIPTVLMEGIITSSTAGLGKKNPNVINYTIFEPLLRDAFALETDHNKVALIINSPGGSPVQSDIIYQLIKDLAAKHKKEVFIFVEDVAASGGLWIAMAGDRIIANENSIVGSIGVISGGFGFHKLMEKHGIDRRIYKVNPFKDFLDPFQEEKPEHVEYLKEIHQELLQRFIEHIKNNRQDKLNESDFDDLFSGKVFSGFKSKELGLIDDLGYINKYMSEHFDNKRPIKFQYFKKKSGMLDGLLNFKSQPLETVVKLDIDALEDSLLSNKYKFK